MVNTSDNQRNFLLIHCSQGCGADSQYYQNRQDLWLLREKTVGKVVALEDMILLPNSRINVPFCSYTYILSYKEAN